MTGQTLNRSRLLSSRAHSSYSGVGLRVNVLGDLCGSLLTDRSDLRDQHLLTQPPAINYC